ncbi:MAG TPA: adenylate/guanylate cyclase domain-containing protein [Intrasporangium sp.]|nr:adenylate/guanylate cyclase domain-containing protein [Intrasporangium sp.]
MADGPGDAGEPGPPSGELPLPQVDRTELLEVLDRVILGETRHLTRLDVCRRAGITPERADELWRSLGFTASTSDDEVRFVDADVRALQLLRELLDGGLVESSSEFALARSMGRSFALLAEWEIAEIATAVIQDPDHLDLEALEELIAVAVPMVEQIQNYTWRRHLANAAGRLLLQPATGEGAVRMAVGFADIVGYTRQSRSLTTAGLAELVETFESTVGTVISDHGGRVIKTIGDEVMFVADDRETAARIALSLAGGHALDHLFPQVRVGVAYGDVLRRLGDVYGEVVNIASRLTTLARPGRVLTNGEMADALADNDEFRVRRARTAVVKGYSRLETWSLRRPKPAPEERAAEKELERAEREARRDERRESRR